ncbi:hypothetical protein TWF281_000237 [Arthrobotrys megalospora]
MAFTLKAELDANSATSWKVFPHSHRNLIDLYMESLDAGTCFVSSKENDTVLGCMGSDASTERFAGTRVFFEGAWQLQVFEAGTKNGLYFEEFVVTHRELDAVDYAGCTIPWRDLECICIERCSQLKGQIHLDCPTQSTFPVSLADS